LERKEERMDYSLLLSKVLSYGIIVGAFVVKVPQILKIVNSKSVKGLVLTSFWLETVGYA
jgi:mannose-P-dolichol utilization defect protein 1